MILLVFLETTLMMVGFNRHLAKTNVLWRLGMDWGVIMGAFFWKRLPEKNCIA